MNISAYWTAAHKGSMPQPRTMTPLLLALNDGSIRAAICIRDDPADEHIRYATVSHENANLLSLDVYDQSGINELDVVEWMYLDDRPHSHLLDLLQILLANDGHGKWDASVYSDARSKISSIVNDLFPPAPGI